MMNIKKEYFIQNYKELYLTLFRSMTTTIEFLQKAQQKTEEMYIKMEGGKKETKTTIFKKKK